MQEYFLEPSRTVALYLKGLAADFLQESQFREPDLRDVSQLATLLGRYYVKTMDRSNTIREITSSIRPWNKAAFDNFTLVRMLAEVDKMREHMEVHGILVDLKVIDNQ